MTLTSDDFDYGSLCSVCLYRSVIVALIRSHTRTYTTHLSHWRWVECISPSLLLLLLLIAAINMQKLFISFCCCYGCCSGCRHWYTWQRRQTGVRKSLTDTNVQQKENHKSEQLTKTNKQMNGNDRTAPRHKTIKWLISMNVGHTMHMCFDHFCCLAKYTNTIDGFANAAIAIVVYGRRFDASVVDRMAKLNSFFLQIDFPSHNIPHTFHFTARHTMTSFTFDNNKTKTEIKKWLNGFGCLPLLKSQFENEMKLIVDTLACTLAITSNTHGWLNSTCVENVVESFLHATTNW